jgi:hypothetical protein
MLRRDATRREPCASHMYHVTHVMSYHLKYLCTVRVVLLQEELALHLQPDPRGGRDAGGALRATSLRDRPAFATLDVLYHVLSNRLILRLPPLDEALAVAGRVSLVPASEDKMVRTWNMWREIKKQLAALDTQSAINGGSYVGQAGNLEFPIPRRRVNFSTRSLRFVPA